jgi:hypothetical protein
LYHVRVTLWVPLWAVLAFLPQSTACQDLASCRQAALDAEARKDFEAFHDLAWKAAARGKPKDPDLMLLVARAQSLSGRPGDALVMLRRIAELGVAPDATGEEFRRVRALPGWPEVETIIAAATDRNREAASAAAAEPPAGPPRPMPEPRPRASTPAARAAAPEPRADALPPAIDGPAAAEAVRLTGDTLDPIGLAYDSASRRFVLGDRGGNRLIVADEVFKRVNALIGAGSGGFGALTALEIDRRRGDLWVTSETGAGRASVHKLQLVSGRVLSRIDVPRKWGPAAIADIAVAGEGTVVLLDSEGARLLLLPQPGRAISRAIPLPVEGPASVAAAGATAYVSYADGLLRADLQSGAVRKVRAPKGASLAGLRRIRWHAAALVAIQHLQDATGVVRIGLDSSGTAATDTSRLDDDTPAEGSALTIAGDTAYYVAREEDAPVIRSVPLR